MKQGSSPLLSRRAIVRSLGYCAAASAVAALPARSAPARSAPATLQSESLAPGLLWIRGAGSNVLALKDPRGLVFLDGGLAANARDVLSLAQSKLDAKHAHTLVNTHWHPEHVGLNEALGKADAKIIAHENTKLWLGTKVELELDGAMVPPLPPRARPNATTYVEGEFTAGDEIVHYGHLPQAHTDGDLYVHLRKANVLLTGGVVFGNGWPIVDYPTGGWISGLVAGYRSLLQVCNDQTRIVTAYGDRVLTRRELDEERTVLAGLSDQLAKMLRSGFGPADVIAAAPARDLESRYGDSRVFLTQSFRSLWGHMAPDA